MLDTVQRVCYALELETESDYSMPERIMVYDACEWEKQIQKKVRQQKRDLAKAAYRDKKSRMAEEDFLVPVITVVLYLGSGHWTGRRRLSELFCIPKELRGMLKKKIPDYAFALLEAESVEAEVFQTELKEFFLALQYRRDKQNLRELLRSEAFCNLSREAKWTIAVYLDREKMAERMEKEGMTMCQAIDELMEDARIEGREEGREAGRIFLLRQMIVNGMDRAVIQKYTGCTEEELAAAAQ